MVKKPDPNVIPIIRPVSQQSQITRKNLLARALSNETNRPDNISKSDMRLSALNEFLNRFRAIERDMWKKPVLQERPFSASSIRTFNVNERKDHICVPNAKKKKTSRKKKFITNFEIEV